MRVFLLSLFFLSITACMSQKKSMPADRAAEPATRITLYAFSATSERDWRVQNDNVMGGRSQSSFAVTDAAHGKFSGTVSLENNGGFASMLHYFPEAIPVAGATAFQLTLRGDGKRYTFRVKSDPEQRHWHQFTFQTSNREAWETICVPFAAMEPYFRGRKLALPPYEGQKVAALQLLIGNKQAQEFAIVLDRFVAVQTCPSDSR